MKGKKKKEEKDRIIRAEDQWEPIGHTPMPHVTDLRNWDRRLMETYPPFYAPFCDLCCLCTYGKCDLTAGNRGACGIDIAGQQGRSVTIACCMGMSAHAGHAAHIIDYLIEKHGEDLPLNLGDQVDVECPNIRTVLGLKPKNLGDLKKAVQYAAEQLVHVLSSVNTGQEGDAVDYESKAMHISMLDHVVMEAADVAQIAGFKYPTSVADTPLVDMGWGSIDASKPVILVVGHNPAASTEIIDYLRKKGLEDTVEVGGICCTALETTRYSDKAKVIGPLSRQLFFVRTGIADVIVTDEQCIRTDMVDEASKVGSVVIASSDKACRGLEEVSNKPTDEVVQAMAEKGKHVLILDHAKAAEVAVEAALKIAPKRKKEKTALIDRAKAQELAQACKECGSCDEVCPNLQSIGSAVKKLAAGDFAPFTAVFESCIGCGKCEQACPQAIPIFQLMQAVASWDTWKCRAGRGPIMDTEIRKVGAPIVLGTIPGVVAFVGCSNFPNEINEIADMVEEFARRKYIVVVSGCSAMAIGMKKDAEGKTLYEKYTGEFDAGGIVNVGSCVANAHIVGAAMKIANIFAKLPLRANYEVIADYIYNRVGAVGVAWGAYSQKAASIATGCNRLGIPVVLGPHSAKYRRLFLSRKEEGDWRVMDGRKKELVDTEEPSPEHLAIVVESKERAMVTIAKLCLRKNDTQPGRQ
ncbi:MAG: CO dehydrogenase/acetyl-CoA synthase complex subunit alpha, partial [Deltaproteobacteria bacterium]|nr:CO dehydrogenase/acetyl-CoA synthase complex subunit alpha [Deltaproteobacteria bacterium]